MKAANERNIDKMKGGASIRRAVVFLLAAFAVEAAGFFASNSLCLLADSLFVFTEFLFFLMVFYRLKSKRTCAFSLFFSLLVFLLGLYIIYLAVYRFIYGSIVVGFEMPIFALAGLLAGTYAIRKSRRYYNLKKGNSLVHVLRKTASSMLVIAAGVWVTFTGEVAADYFL